MNQFKEVPLTRDSILKRIITQAVAITENNGSVCETIRAHYQWEFDFKLINMTPREIVLGCCSSCAWERMYYTTPELTLLLGKKVRVRLIPSMQMDKIIPADYPE